MTEPFWDGFAMRLFVAAMKTQSIIASKRKIDYNTDKNGIKRMKVLYIDWKSK